MKKIILSLVVFVAYSCLVIHDAQAGLINYDRRKKKGAPPARGAAAPRPAAAAAAPSVVPMWAKVTPGVKNAAERVYDVNRDGKLQPAEIKIYLRGVIEVIQAKGGFTLNSDILKEYDKNKDGIISRTELPDLKRDAES